jgi:hypothetical protein
MSTPKLKKEDLIDESEIRLKINRKKLFWKVVKLMPSEIRSEYLSSTDENKRHIEVALSDDFWNAFEHLIISLGLCTKKDIDEREEMT